MDPIFFDKTYHLGPRDAEYGKVYSLLEQALAKAGKAGIATFVMRQHAYLAALEAENGILRRSRGGCPARASHRPQYARRHRTRDAPRSGGAPSAQPDQTVPATPECSLVRYWPAPGGGGPLPSSS
ncbi:Ku protein [Streptomyces sp. NPDC055287]